MYHNEVYDDEKCYDDNYQKKEYFDGYYTEPLDNPYADVYEIRIDELNEKIWDYEKRAMMIRNDRLLWCLDEEFQAYSQYKAEMKYYEQIEEKYFEEQELEQKLIEKNIHKRKNYNQQSISNPIKNFVEKRNIKNLIHFP